MSFELIVAALVSFVVGLRVGGSFSRSAWENECLGLINKATAWEREALGLQGKLVDARREIHELKRGGIES